MRAKKLKRSFFARPTLQVAPELLGKILVYHDNSGRRLEGRLVEVEAYIGEDDPACHASVGRTPRNEIMYGPPGFLYVYFTYGNHYMLNFVTESKGFPAAVLVRGMEPITGVETMMKNRNVADVREVASGPGKLARALGVTTRQKGLDLTGNRIFLLDAGRAEGRIWRSPRIGIGDNGADKLWRFYIKDNPHVSKGTKKIRAGSEFCGRAEGKGQNCA